MPAAQTHVHALKNIILLACVSVRVYMHLQTNILMHTSPHACVRRCLVRVAAHVSHTNTHIHTHTHTHKDFQDFEFFAAVYLCVDFFVRSPSFLLFRFSPCADYFGSTTKHAHIIFLHAGSYGFCRRAPKASIRR